MPIIHHHALRKQPHENSAGFTLVELAIVIAVMGLLAAGVMMGRDLLRAANVQATIAQKARFDNAFNAFKQRFDCLPGDCTLTEDNILPGLKIPGGHVSEGMRSTGAGDGAIWFGTPDQSNYNTNKQKYLWVQLANVGLLSDKVTAGYGGTLYGGPTVPGLHSPTCAICSMNSYTYGADTVQAGGWGVLDGNALSTLACNSFSMSYNGNVPKEPVYWLHNVGLNSTAASTYPGPISGEDGYLLDAKMDDGRPLTGGVIAMWNNYYSDAGCSGSNVYMAIAAPQCATLASNIYSMSIGGPCMDMMIKAGW